MKPHKHSCSYILIPIFFLCCQCSFGQQNLTGKITDKDNQILPGVSVFIPDIQRSTISDDKGNYKFDKLPKSIVHIQYSSIGYKTAVKTANLATTTTLDVVMESSVTELEDVLITSNNSKLTDNTPFSANSVSQAEIRKYSSPSVMGNLSYQPGIDKINIGNGISKPVIRGLSFNQIMLYSQGTRIENQQWDDHHDLGLTDVGVENVEIVRGPAALIYGANALGGALIFRDEKPAMQGTTIADANLGFASNTLGINGDAGIKSAAKNGFFYGLRIGGASHTSYIQGEDEDEVKPAGEEKEFAANSKFMNTVAKANIGYTGNWGVSKLSYSFLNQQIGIIEDESANSTGGNDEADQRDREMEAPYQDVTSQIISTENTFFTGKSKINFNLAYQTNDRKEYEPLPAKQKELAIGLQLNVTTFDVKWTSNAEKNFGYTIGTQGTFLKNENNGKESLVPNANENDFAGYGLLRYDYKKFNFLGGLRFDSRHIEAESYETGVEEDSFVVLSTPGFENTGIDTLTKLPEVDFENDYTPFSFSLGTSFNANEHLTLKINGATGFSAPNYAQLGTFGKHEGTYRFEIGNTKFNMEQNLEFDLGVIWENEFITFNWSGYINKIKDYIYIENSGDTMVKITPDGRDTLPIYNYKQNDATLSGFELGLDVHPKSLPWLDFKVSYAMMNGELDKGGNLPYIPSAKTIGEIKLQKEKLWKLNSPYFSFIVCHYDEQSNVAEYEITSESYTLLDTHIGSSFKLGKQNATFDIFCTNLLNTGYYNQLSLVKNIGVRDMGRNIGVSLHIPLYFHNK